MEKGIVALRMVAVTHRMNIRNIDPYKGTDVEWHISLKKQINIHIKPKYVNATVHICPYIYTYIQTFILTQFRKSFRYAIISLAHPKQAFL